MKVSPRQNFFLLWLILTFAAACASEKGTAVPDRLVGLWKTAAPKYSGRFLRITAESIVLGAGEGRTNIHPIVGVKEKQKEGANLYTISYLNDDGQEYRLSLYMDPTREGVIRFKNQPGILWTKDQEP